MKRINLVFIVALMAVMGLFTSCNEEPIPTNTVTDIDGNVYHTITIGTQTWMVENLMTTHYNDGTSIPYVTDNIHWNILASPAYCWYNNDAANNKNIHGALYNWYAVNTGKLAPKGWHVATDAEWTTLQNYVNANLGISPSVAKALAATTYWVFDSSANTIGNDLSKNNSTGFTALPSGFRNNTGSFTTIGLYGYFWTSSNKDSQSAWYRVLYFNDSNAGKSDNVYKYAMSVRCIKD